MILLTLGFIVFFYVSNIWRYLKDKVLYKLPNGPIPLPIIGKSTSIGNKSLGNNMFN